MEVLCRIFYRFFLNSLEILCKFLFGFLLDSLEIIFPFFVDILKILCRYFGDSLEKDTYVIVGWANSLRFKILTDIQFSGNFFTTVMSECLECLVPKPYYVHIPFLNGHRWVSYHSFAYHIRNIIHSGLIQ